VNPAAQETAMETLDLRNLDCPQPVLRTKEAVEGNPNTTFTVLVSQAIQCENVARMARSLGASVETQELDGGEHQLTIATAEAPAEPVTEPELEPCPTDASAARPVIFIRNDVLGHGDPQLGRILMKAFLKTLPSAEPLPAKLIFINAGVHLTTEGSEEIEPLRELADRGVEIVSCGTCLDFYGKADQVEVGIVGNMYDIVESLARAAKVITA
jgi:selenium metabolism protein YedF